MVICAERQPPCKLEPCRPGEGAKYLLDVHGDAERERPRHSERADEQGVCSVESPHVVVQSTEPVGRATGVLLNQAAVHATNPLP